MDKPLTSFTPIVKQAIIGLSPKALSFYFSVAEYLATRGIVSPEDPSFAFFFCFAGARTLRAGGADSVKPCPTRGGHPKGLGLEGIRGASYAFTVPAKQKRSLERSVSGSENKLQV
jgi:hypothetical protein